MDESPEADPLESTATRVKRDVMAGLFESKRRHRGSSRVGRYALLGYDSGAAGCRLLGGVLRGVLGTCLVDAPNG